jgi:hypothetical protein
MLPFQLNQFSNLISGADVLVKEGIFQKISSLLKIETNPNIIVSCIRIVSAVSKNNLARVCYFC